MHLSDSLIQCPLMCFCKPSAAHLYTSKPLKLESAPRAVASTVYAVSGVKEEGRVVDAKHEAETARKSCIRKLCPRPDSTRQVGKKKKKKVQWMDHLGEELAEIREFESSDSGDTDNEEESSRCLCVIL
ncbi:uncharacterized protein LOC130999590 isoform X2 [Salvia miltiorrhiza]|uniref:uncharacterized protein LOC130999590 isoform X2 n=1 Tax=Salvia miltiorrhiza TaxID=226208 RepID=UPI0025ACA1C3|nr:uncharacterized protein LOC130999590 isoform X2 [Salvia miltiorrhiza]XP_057781145.1 uncharacterized protein LOC130999590 isoform X2 [Salvia miltiorrhiza]